MGTFNLWEVPDEKLVEQIQLRWKRLAEIQEEIPRVRALDPKDPAHRFIGFKGDGRATGSVLTPKRYAAVLTRERNKLRKEVEALEAEQQRRAVTPA